jgi:ribonuclease T1
VKLLSGLLLAVASSVLAFSLGEIRAAQLPAQARDAIVLIRKGGPFPYERDGAVFGNREKLLPARERGWYREYTVRTPGERSRGARRIVAGRDGTLYYTDDHYRSFRRILE